VEWITPETAYGAASVLALGYAPLWWLLQQERKRADRAMDGLLAMHVLLTAIRERVS